MNEILDDYSSHMIAIWKNSAMLPSPYEKEILNHNRMNLIECRRIVLFLIDMDAQYEQFDISNDFSMLLLSDITCKLFDQAHYKYFRFPNSNLKKLDRILAEIYNSFIDILVLTYQ
jgi:hypothetical protein